MNKPPPPIRPHAHWVLRPFALPRGVVGWVAGALMAGGNADMARLTVELLEPAPTDRVLEVGFGPGVAIHLLAACTTAGFTAGVDPSRVMLAQARRRNRDAVASGRVGLRLGSSHHIPWPDRSFDRVCSINNVMLWDVRPDAGEVRRVVRDGGRLVVAVHEWTLGGEGGRVLRLGAKFPSLEDVLQALERARFGGLDVRRLATRSGPAVFILAEAR